MEDPYEPGPRPAPMPRWPLFVAVAGTVSSLVLERAWDHYDLSQHFPEKEGIDGMIRLMGENLYMAVPVIAIVAMLWSFRRVGRQIHDWQEKVDIANRRGIVRVSLLPYRRIIRDAAEYQGAIRDILADPSVDGYRGQELADKLVGECSSWLRQELTEVPRDIATATSLAAAPDHPPGAAPGGHDSQGGGFMVPAPEPPARLLADLDAKLDVLTSRLIRRFPALKAAPRD